MFRLPLAAEVWRRCRVCGMGRWATFPYANHRRGSYSSLLWGGKRVSPVSSFVRVFSPAAPVEVDPSGDLQEETRDIWDKIVQDVMNGREWAFQCSFVPYIRGSRVSP